MLRLTVLYAAKRTGNAGRWLHVYGLCEGGIAVADNNGNRNDRSIATAVPVLKNYELGVTNNS